MSLRIVQRDLVASPREAFCTWMEQSGRHTRWLRRPNVLGKLGHFDYCLPTRRRRQCNQNQQIWSSQRSHATVRNAIGRSVEEIVHKEDERADRASSPNTYPRSRGGEHTEWERTSRELRSTAYRSMRFTYRQNRKLPWCLGKWQRLGFGKSDCVQAVDGQLRFDLCGRGQGEFSSLFTTLELPQCRVCRRQRTLETLKWKRTNWFPDDWNTLCCKPFFKIGTIIDSFPGYGNLSAVRTFENRDVCSFSRTNPNSTASLNQNFPRTSYRITPKGIFASHVTSIPRNANFRLHGTWMVILPWCSMVSICIF